ncbi:50S ribosomal protein L11 methylase-like protein [Nitzschia inconspicua]|uniref:50S ribosomal protein L11 methylase-like protein n=1 Tax=Nitzschia inconspicua TaxID=303405 RepID=A0A9K3KD24_9STRA|nr:50S ribosomal protein L11 methylase-like protein [Nitzschia inconspicua]
MTTLLFISFESVYCLLPSVLISGLLGTIFCIQRPYKANGIHFFSSLARQLSKNRSPSSQVSLLSSKQHQTQQTIFDKMPDEEFANTSGNGEIPSFGGDEKAKASDFANYFCSYAQLYHQKTMLADHNRMAAYHSAILGNTDVFKDKVVMDVGTGSGILAVWAAQAGARKVYAIEYTDMANHARSVMKANNVDHIVTVIQGAVEDVELPIEADGLESDDPVNHPKRVVDIFISEWMGYFLLRESMLDSLIRARDKFLKPATGLMFPSHCTMYVAPVQDEEERRANNNEYAAAMSDWNDFHETTRQVYGVNMEVLAKDFDREQKEYFLYSSRWRELPDDVVLAEPQPIKFLDMMTVTIDESKGIANGDKHSKFSFDVDGTQVQGPISGLAGWFTSDFKSRTDENGANAPKINRPSFLSTGPENGYTHWGQQVFYFPSGIPLLTNQTTKLTGTIEMMRTKENARLYNVRLTYESTRHKNDDPEAHVLMKSDETEQVYTIP